MRLAAKLAISLSAGVALVVLGAGPAAAQGCLLDLSGSDGEFEFTGLAPGDGRSWDATVRNVAPGRIELVLELDGAGPMTPAMSVAVDACSVPWVGPVGGAYTCPGTETLVLADTPVAAASSAIGLPDLEEGESWYGRFVGTFAASAGDEHQGATGSVLATFTAAGEQGDVCSTPTTTTTTTTPGSGPPTTDPVDPGAGPGGPGGPGAGPPGPQDGGRPGESWPMPVTGGGVLSLVVVGLGLIAVGLPMRRRAASGREPAPTIEG